MEEKQERKELLNPQHQIDISGSNQEYIPRESVYVPPNLEEGKQGEASNYKTEEIKIGIPVLEPDVYQQGQQEKQEVQSLQTHQEASEKAETVKPTKQKSDQTEQHNLIHSSPEIESFKYKYSIRPNKDGIGI